MSLDHSTKKDIARKYLLSVGRNIEASLEYAKESYGSGFAAKLEELAMAGTKKGFNEISNSDPEFIKWIKATGKIYREGVPSTPYAKDIPSIWKHNVLRSYSPKTTAIEYAMTIDLFESLFEEEQMQDSPQKKEAEMREYISKMGEKLEGAVEKSMSESTLTTALLSQYLDKALVNGTDESIRHLRMQEPKFDVFCANVIKKFSNVLDAAPHLDVDGQKSVIVRSLRKHRPKEHRMIYDQTIDLLETGFLGGNTGAEEE
ncbi:MAG: hypothetical protein HZB68_03625 [Candidatus Aenigmarchaeota archaeon]|nr:hypothetical protein [Candidatus Aenigmarchaeota archaeon]